MIKMKLLLVACLVAVCSAAPPVPVVAPAFCASGEIYFHDSEDTKFGKCNLREITINYLPTTHVYVLH